jgi:2'-5' RNA ligase
MASNPTEFWHRRRDLTPSTEAGASGGADSYRLVLLVDITDPDVLSACGQVTGTLDRFDCFDAAASGVHHITIKTFDVGAEPSMDNLLDRSAVVQRVDRAVSDVISACDPFAIDLTRLNLFPDIVYGEVADGGQLADLNRRLCDHAGITTLDRDRDEFIPHLTLGYFSGDGDYEALVTFLETNRQLQFPTVPVEEVTLAAYEVGGRPPAYNHLETYEL